MKKILVIFLILILAVPLFGQEAFKSAGRTSVRNDTTTGSKAFGRLISTKEDSLLWMGTGFALKQVATWGDTFALMKLKLDTLAGFSNDSVFTKADMIFLQDILFKASTTNKSYWIDSGGDTVIVIDPNVSGNPSLYLISTDKSDTLRLYHNNTDGYILTEGKLVLGGHKKTNNENLQIDFETTSNEIGLSSGTGATTVDLKALNLETAAKFDADYAEAATATDPTRYYDFRTDINANQNASADGLATLYGRINWNKDDNSNVLLHGVEGVASSSKPDESVTLRGGYFRTYVQAHGDAPGSTARTNIGADISARAGYTGGLATNPESGSAFVGLRVWMAPNFASTANINNFHGLWMLNEVAATPVTNAIKIDATTYGSGFTNCFNTDAGKYYQRLNGATAGSGLVAGETSTASGDDWMTVIADDYRTLTTGQTYRAGYFRNNIRSTTPSNPTAEVTGLESVAGAYVNDEALTYRGIYGRTYTNADASSSMRTAIGGEFSARASYAGGTECVAEGGTAFVGARIWMAPYFTAGTLANVNNHHGLWIYNEHPTNAVTNAIMVNNAASGGYTNGLNFTGANITNEIVGSQGEYWKNTTNDKWETDAAVVVADSFRNNGPSRLIGEVTMGTTATPVVISTAGKGTFADSVVSLKGIRSEGTGLFKDVLTIRKPTLASLIELDMSGIADSYTRIAYKNDLCTWLAGAYNTATQKGFNFETNATGSWLNAFRLENDLTAVAYGNFRIGNSTIADQQNVNLTINVDANAGVSAITNETYTVAYNRNESVWEHTLTQAIGHQYTTMKNAGSGYYPMILKDATSMALGVGGGLCFTGNYSGTSTTMAGAIDAYKEDATGGNYGFNLRFLTRQNGVATLQERLRIKATGEIGIGTTTPGAKLEVSGTKSTDTLFSVYNDKLGAAPRDSSFEILSDGAVSWSGGAVIYVPLTGNLQTYITNAPAGATLILASGEYVVTNLTIAKQLNIVGQGNAGFYTISAAAQHGTVISNVTGGTCFQINASNVRIAHLSINMSGASCVGINTASDLTGLVFTNIDVIIAGSAISEAFTIKGSNTVLRDLSFYITSSNSSASGVAFWNDATTTQNAICDIYNVTGYVKGTSAAGGSYAYGFVCENTNDANTLTMNISNSSCTVAEGTVLDVGVASISTTTFTSTVNTFLCTFNGGDYDAYQTGSNVLALGGSVIVNNVTSGTVTYRATMIAGTVVGTSYGSDASISDAELLLMDNVVYSHEVWVTSASQNPALITLPANAKVIQIEVWVSEAFTSDGTDLLTIGYDAATNAYMTDLDVASTGVKTVTLGTTSKTVDATSRAVEVYYTNGGSEPGAGKAHVSISWIQCTVSP